MSNFRFGKKQKLPSIVQLKYQILTNWLKEQRAKEAAEAEATQIRLQQARLH